jgi:hypothetical protein
MADKYNKAPNEGGTSSGGKTVVVRRTTCIIEALPSADRKQYVNLDFDATKPELGRDVTINAKVWPKRQGVEVYWFIGEPTANPLNRTGLPPAKKAQLTNTMTVTNANGIAEVTLRLSLYGGDKFRVGAALSPVETPEKYTGWLEVWRKLWYEVDSMQKDGGGGNLTIDLTKFLNVYKALFIELEQEGKDNNPSFKSCLLKSEATAFAAKYFGAGKSPYQAHITSVNRLVAYNETAFLFSVKSDKFTDTEKRHYWPFDPADSWLVVAEYWNTETSKFEATDKKYFKLVSRTAEDDSKIEMDFTGFSLIPTEKKPLWIKLKVRIFRDIGLSTPPEITIPTGYIGKLLGVNAQDYLSNVVVHELGHGIGMVPSSSAHAYTNPGVGSHCMYPSTPPYRDGDGHSCVMHHSTLGIADYCPMCGEIVREQVMDKATLKKNGWEAVKGSGA